MVRCEDRSAGVKIFPTGIAGWVQVLIDYCGVG